MSQRAKMHIVMSVAALAVLSAATAGGQAVAQQAPPPARAALVAPPLILPPAPSVPTRRSAALQTTTSASALVAPIAPPSGPPLPDASGRSSQRIALATPTPLVRPTPVRRVRDLGVVRSEVAGPAVRAGANGRCKDGTFLTVAATDEACAGKGGLAVRFPSAPVAPVAPPRRP